MYATYYRVTIVKDKDTRRSKGVAFVLFLDRESARNCVRAVNNKQVRIVYSEALSYGITGILWSYLSFFPSFVLSCLAEQLRQASQSTTDGRQSLSGDETTQTNLSVTNVGYVHTYVHWCVTIVKCCWYGKMKWYLCVSFESHAFTGYRSSELRMPQKYFRWQRPSKEKRKEKEEKVRTARPCVCILKLIFYFRECSIFWIRIVVM